MACCNHFGALRCHGRVASSTTINRQFISADYLGNLVPLDKVQQVTGPVVVSVSHKRAVLSIKGEQPQADMLEKLHKTAGKLGANTLLNTLLIVQSHRAKLIEHYTILI